MNPLELTRALKGRWHGAYGTARCPAHDDRSPSLSIAIAKDGRTLVKCHAGCSQDAVIGALTALNLWRGEPSQPSPVHAEAARRNPNGEYALKLWAECRPAQGTIVEVYLRSRGITIPVPDSLRFHPKLKYPEGGTWPAMVAVVQRGPDGAAIAIHRTFLKPDGSGKAPVQKQKMMLGPCQGGAVRLAEAGDWLGVGEGIETCLTVLQEVGKPVWAALSTSGLKALELPPIVKEVTVLADADAAGEEAALDAGRRWKRAGLIAKIARPDDGCSDFNDVLLIGRYVMSVIKMIAGASEVKPSYDEIVQMLADMDDVEYDRCRHAKAIEWDVRLETLDLLRKQAILVRSYHGGPTRDDTEPDPDDLKDRLQHILDTEGILDLWIQSWDKVMAGEHRNAKLLYLVATSRLFDNCMHVAIKGPSSGGKSQIRKQVLEFFPGEDMVPSPRCRRRRCSITRVTSVTKFVDGRGGRLPRAGLQDLLLRELMSEGSLTIPSPEVNGQIVRSSSSRTALSASWSRRPRRLCIPRTKRGCSRLRSTIARRRRSG